MGVQITDQSKQIAHPGYKSGLYYGLSPAYYSENNLDNDTIYFSPAFVAHKIKIDRIRIKVAQGGVGTVKLGIYQNKDSYPYSLFLDAGEIDTSTAGLKEAVISQSLNPGWYFFSLLCKSAARFTLLSGCQDKFLGSSYFFEGLYGYGLYNPGGILPQEINTNSIYLTSVPSAFWFRIS